MWLWLAAKGNLEFCKTELDGDRESDDCGPDRTGQGSGGGMEAQARTEGGTATPSRRRISSEGRETKVLNDLPTKPVPPVEADRFEFSGWLFGIATGIYFPYISTLMI
jgi:hypothetical protein